MTPKKTSRPLGKDQLSWLRSIEDHRSQQWYPNCGFYWDCRSRTVALCESLVRRGLLRKVDDRPTYEITPAGKKVAKAGLKPL